MIFIKNSEQIKQMKEAGRITGEAIAIAGEMVREGVTTKQLDTKIRNHIEKCGARPSFLGYGGFPGSACISVNSQVIHGIPSDKVVLKEGDIVKIDEIENSLLINTFDKIRDQVDFKISIDEINGIFHDISISNNDTICCMKHFL